MTYTVKFKSKKPLEGNDKMCCWCYEISTTDGTEKPAFWGLDISSQIDIQWSDSKWGHQKGCDDYQFGTSSDYPGSKKEDSWNRRNVGPHGTKWIPNKYWRKDTDEPKDKFKLELCFVAPCKEDEKTEISLERGVFQEPDTDGLSRFDHWEKVEFEGPQKMQGPAASATRVPLRFILAGLVIFLLGLAAFALIIMLRPAPTMMVGAKGNFRVELADPGDQHVGVPFQATAYVTRLQGTGRWELIGEWIAGSRSEPARLVPARIPLAPDRTINPSISMQYDHKQTNEFTCREAGRTALTYIAHISPEDTIIAESAPFLCIAPTPTPTNTPTPIPSVPPFACIPSPEAYDPPSGKTVTQHAVNFEWRSGYGLRPGESYALLLADNAATLQIPPNTVVPASLILARTAERRRTVEFGSLGLGRPYYWAVVIVSQNGLRLDCGREPNVFILQEPPPTRAPTRPPEKPPTPLG